MHFVRGHRAAVAIAIAVAMAACGGGDDTPSDDTQGPTGQTPNTAAEPAPDATEATPDTTSGESAPPPAAGGGSATLVIAGETIEFDNFACYYDDDAAEAFGDDDLNFAALGQNGNAVIAVSALETLGDINFTVLYNPNDGSGLIWQRVGSGEATVENGQVTSDGEFDRIADGEHTDETDPGSLQATCG